MTQAELFFLKWERRQKVISDIDMKGVVSVYKQVERNEELIDEHDDRFELTFPDGTVATVPKDGGPVSIGMVEP